MVFGFGGVDLAGRLIYAARITDKLADGIYYRALCFQHRPDCIYEDVNGAARLRQGARFHQSGSQLHKDVGAHFENAYVLLSDDFRYYGAQGTTDYRKRYSALSDMVRDLEIGHRRFHDPAVFDDLSKLKVELWKTPSRLNTAYKPLDEQVFYLPIQSSPAP